MAVKIKNRGDALNSMNMTPMIDVVFQLLIFFLVATKFAEDEKEIELNIPQASEAAPMVSAPRDLFVNVTADGKFFVQGKIMNADELDSALRNAAAANRGQQNVMIRADKDSKTKHIVEVANLCRRYNIRYLLAAQD